MKIFKKLMGCSGSAARVIDFVTEVIDLVTQVIVSVTRVIHSVTKMIDFVTEVIVSVTQVIDFVTEMIDFMTEVINSVAQMINNSLVSQIPKLLLPRRDSAAFGANFIESRSRGGFKNREPGKRGRRRIKAISLLGSSELAGGVPKCCRRHPSFSCKLFYEVSVILKSGRTRNFIQAHTGMR